MSPGVGHLCALCMSCTVLYCTLHSLWFTIQRNMQTQLMQEWDSILILHAQIRSSPPPQYMYSVHVLEAYAVYCVVYCEPACAVEV